MEDINENSRPAVGRRLIVKADEVDQVGTVIQSPSKQLPLSALYQRDAAAPAANRTIQAKSARPVLRRDGSAPPPPSQPPPPAPSLQQNPDTPTDSLSLPQLKQLVSQFPKTEQRAYAFQYADAQSFAEEIEEWFQYSEQDGSMILGAKDAFEQKWRSFYDADKEIIEEDHSWLEVSQRVRRGFLMSVLSSLDHSDGVARIEALEVIFYVLGGIWATTAGLESHKDPENQSTDENDEHQGNPIQIEWMHKGADLLLECSGLQRLFDCTKTLFDDDDERYVRIWIFLVHPLTRFSLTSPTGGRGDSENGPDTSEDTKTRERALLLSCWYLFVESARSRTDLQLSASMRRKICMLYRF